MIAGKNRGDVAKFKRIDDTSLTNMSSRFVADDNTLECKSIPWVMKRRMQLG